MSKDYNLDDYDIYDFWNTMSNIYARNRHRYGYGTMVLFWETLNTLDGVYGEEEEE